MPYKYRWEQWVSKHIYTWRGVWYRDCLVVLADGFARETCSRPLSNVYVKSLFKKVINLTLLKSEFYQPVITALWNEIINVIFVALEEKFPKLETIVLIEISLLEFVQSNFHYFPLFAFFPCFCFVPANHISFQPRFQSPFCKSHTRLFCIRGTWMLPVNWRPPTMK